MQTPPSKFRFSLRALFVATAFVALGLGALKYPFEWVLFGVDLAVALSVVFALVSALVSAGSRRLYWAAYTASAFAFLLMGTEPTLTFLPPKLLNIICEAMHPMYVPIDRVSFESLDMESAGFFLEIANRLGVVVFSTVAAYIIPWLVQRGQKPPP
jgi:hypothetical protein